MIYVLKAGLVPKKGPPFVIVVASDKYKKAHRVMAERLGVTKSSDLLMMGVEVEKRETIAFAADPDEFED